MGVNRITKHIAIFDSLPEEQQNEFKKVNNQQSIDFSNIVLEMLDTYCRKNHDYGNSFGKTYHQLGIISAVTRISDKFNRLVNLGVNKQNDIKVSDESLEDTLLDLATYCVMTVMELRYPEEGR